MWGRRIEYRCAVALMCIVVLVCAGSAAAAPKGPSVAQVLPLHIGDVQASTAPFLGLKIHSKRDGHLVSTRQFSLPIQVDVVARTDSTNIRLYYGDKGIVIFNWEVNPKELRYRDPATGKDSGVADKGLIPKDQWVKLTWIIEEDHWRVLVDDQERATVKGQFKGLPASSIGIGPANGSTIIVRSIRMTASGRETLGGPPIEPATQPAQDVADNPTGSAPAAASANTAGDVPAMPVVRSSAMGYQQPDLAAQIFNAQKLQITAEQRHAIADALAGYARDHSRNARERGLASRMLGIALRVEPQNRSAVVLNARLARAEFPEAPSTQPVNLAQQLVPMAQQCQAAKSPDDQALAGYLYAIVLSIDPKNDEAIYQSEMLRQAGVKVRWDWAGESQASSGGAQPFVRRQSTIKGMVVLIDGSGRMAGGLSEDIITVMPGKAPPGGARFMREVGKEMQVAMDEAVRAVRVRYPLWEEADVQISFDDKFTKLDGPSAGTAFALLMLSALEGFDIDQNIAITGDITVDGKLRKIGGVDPKIRGATSLGMNAVIIPDENKDRLNDFLVLNGPAALWNVQIFSASTLDDAMHIIRTDRESDIDNAMKLFTELQTACKKSGIVALTSEDARTKLDQILHYAPNHQSARFLQLIATKKQPTKLSLGGSVSHALAPLLPLQDTLFGDTAPTRDTFPETTAAQLRADLRELKRICHPDSARLVDACYEFVDAASHATTPMGLQRFNTKRMAIVSELDRLEAKKDTFEQLIRDGQ